MKPVISAEYLKQTLTVVSHYGFDEEECRRAAGLQADLNQVRISAKHVVDLFNYISKTLDDPLFGIKCALKYPLTQFDQTGDLLKICRDIEEACNVYHTYCSLYHTVGVSSGMLSDERADRLEWYANISSDQIASYQQLIEYILTHYLTSLKWLGWQFPHVIKRIDFKHQAIAEVSKYEDLFGCDVKFGQAEYSLIFEDNVKNAPLPTADPKKLAFAREKLDRAIYKMRGEYNFLDRVQHQIVKLIESGAANKKAMAQELGLSERSLTRKLSEKGTSFKELKTQVVKKLSVSKIEQGLPLTTIAQSLGYNDQAAFTRAFKKWYGETPSQRKARVNAK